MRLTPQDPSVHDRIDIETSRQARVLLMVLGPIALVVVAILIAIPAIRRRRMR